MFKRLGFTLIEVLLVVTLLAVIAGIAVMTVRKEAERNRVQQTALSVQGVLQAAMAYDVNTQGWPDASFCSDAGNCSTSDISCDDVAPVSSGAFIDSYLPNASTTSNIGVHYCWSPGANSGGEIKESSPTFWVALKVPLVGSTIGPEGLNFAQQVAARLPGGSAVESLTTSGGCTAASTSCYIKSDIAQPGPASNEQTGLKVVGFGTCCTNTSEGCTIAQQGDVACTYQGVSATTPNCPAQYQIDVTCPSGFTGHVSAWKSYSSITNNSYLYVQSQIHNSVTYGGCTQNGNTFECTIDQPYLIHWVDQSDGASGVWGPLCATKPSGYDGPPAWEPSNFILGITYKGYCTRTPTVKAQAKTLY